MKTFTLCCTLLGLVVLGTRADNFTRPGHRKDWPAIDRLGAFADTIDWFAKFEERVYLVTKDDRVYAFGNQTAGKVMLGLNIAKGVNVTTPTEMVELRGKKIVKFASSYHHMLALSADGHVWAWGENSYAELGVGQSNDHLTPVPVEKLVDVIDIVAAYGFSLALTKSGQVFGWGYNGNDQCGVGVSDIIKTSPVRAHLDQVVRSLHTAYYGTSLVLTDKAQLYVWGPDAASSPTLLPLAPKQMMLAPTYYHYYMLSGEGHIWRSVSNSQLRYAQFYEGAMLFKALWADPLWDAFLVAEATDGKLWAWTDPDSNKPPVLLNTKDIVQAFAVYNSKGSLPFMVKLA